MAAAAVAAAPPLRYVTRPGAPIAAALARAHAARSTALPRLGNGDGAGGASQGHRHLHARKLWDGGQLLLDLSSAALLHQQVGKRAALVHLGAAADGCVVDTGGERAALGEAGVEGEGRARSSIASTQQGQQQQNKTVALT